MISDIHANLTALETVLEDAGDYDAVWCLGDLVGYGPDPNECIEVVQTLPNLKCLIGNHDQAALGLIPLERFNMDAHQAAAWTQNVLTEENSGFLYDLPELIEVERFVLSHGSPRNPMWEYILDPFVADRNFDFMQHDFALVGHSHLPLIFSRKPEEDVAINIPVLAQQPVTLEPQMILNPGSVGQPRDLDRRASYAILDLAELTWQLHRVEYNFSSVQLRILEAGLPERQALRLSAGW
ncbi:MAG: metallophosphoesterase family protein [Anaerolineales bacterium]|nr:metallophosphoesterase family protein [Anaerolineales bacterium]